MTWEWALLLYGAIITLTLIGGVAIGTSLGLVGVIGVALASGTGLWLSFGEIVWNTTTSFTLVSVPLFVLMGEIILRGGMSKRFYEGISHLIQGVPGGLAHTNILGCAIFAALSGSTVATAMTMGTVAIPEMQKRGYKDELIFGTLTGGGCLGILIPPSIPMIVYGLVANVSVLDLFMAGVVPGLLLMVVFLVYVGVVVFLNPDQAPREKSLLTFKIVVTGIKDSLPIMIIILSVLGGMYWGVVTPTEAAGFGCLISLLLSVIYRDLTWRGFYLALRNATVTSCVVMFIVINSQFLSFAVVQSGIGRGLSNALIQSNLSPFLFFCALVAIYIVIGMFIDGLSIMLLTVPVLFPGLAALGYDPIWLGIVIVVLIELGALTPPMGLNLFAIQSTAPEISLSTVSRASRPFAVIILIFCFVLYAFPDIALFLPRIMRGG